MPNNLLENSPAVDFTGKSWYKKGWGVVLIVVLSLFALGALVFMALFGYYAWQIKYGSKENTTKIAEGFTPQFTTSKLLAGGALNNQNNKIDNFTEYIRTGNPIFGNKQAKIVIMSFIDFECPYSQSAHAYFKKVMEKYEPVVKFVFKNTPLVDIHTEAMPAAMAGTCAGAQNKFWQYHDYLFATKLFDDQSLLNAALATGLDHNKFSICLENKQYQKIIDQDLRDALIMGVNGTPTYFINGQKIEGVLTVEEWDQIILKFLK